MSRSQGSLTDSPCHRQHSDLCLRKEATQVVQSGNRKRDWGAKYDTFGNKLTWFGYKIHLAVDTQSELPYPEVTPAHVYDGEMAIPLMKDVAENLGWKFKFVMMDAGYDQVKNYEAARSYAVYTSLR